MVDITSIIVCFIALLSALLASFVVPWLKTKIAKDKQELVFDVANAVVLAVEQVYTALDGESKKKKAIENIKNRLALCGITVNEQIIDDAIESSVKSMNMLIKGC